jgi:hypothetical protein
MGAFLIIFVPAILLSVWLAFDYPPDRLQQFKDEMKRREERMKTDD